MKNNGKVISDILIIANMLFVEFWNHAITVELLYGLGCQFGGGITLISALAKL